MKIKSANFGTGPIVWTSQNEIKVCYMSGWFQLNELFVTRDLVAWGILKAGTKLKKSAALGWGLLGGLLAGGAGLAAAAWIGGTKKRITVVCQFKEECYCIIEMSPSEFQHFYALAPKGTYVE